MTAWIRSVQPNLISAGAGTATRGEAKVGDVLLAFQSADSGGHGALFLDGDWLFEDDHPGGFWPGSVSGTWAGVIVWKRTCELGEPTTYSAFQGSVADGTVLIVAIADADPDSIQIDRQAGTTTPGMTPNAASGLEIRYATGVPSPPGASVSWSTPTGYTERADAQSHVWTSAVLATRPVVSTASLGEVVLTPTQSLAAAAFTIIVASTTPPVPQPPVVQPFAPGVGGAVWRYEFFRLLDRTFLGSLALPDAVFDARLLQPGQLTATIPIPNRREADRVAEIIPREAVNDPDSYPLDRGPGVIVCQILREGEPQAEYWINGTKLTRSRRGGVGIALRGVTLDGYLNAVEIEDDLNYAGDQIDIARSLLTHLMAQPNSNISLDLQAGSSGVSRELAILESEGRKYGQVLLDLAQASGGFETQIRLERVDGALVRRWVWGMPLGQADPVLHTWADGRNNGDILEYTEEADAARGATRWRARGNSISADASVPSVPLLSTAHEATAHLAAGWPRTSRTLSYNTQTDLPTLEEYAAYWAARAGGALRVDMATVTFGKIVTFSPNSLGDVGRFYLHNAWHQGVWRRRRIIGIGITPISKQTGKEEARLVLEGQEAPDA
ncbi:hypothetical protein [Nonomuraea sp. NPDC049141]|uniref:hypothetical protein n=1 Tax=Nonomuraea sp. NPDC049141 TaxID=3155500 RepID=UPI0033C67F9A